MGKDLISYQGGNQKVVNDYSLLGCAEEIIEVKYFGKTPVYIEKLDALMIGEAAMLLGAGRETKEQAIDPTVGVVLNKKIGDKVLPNDIIAYVHTNGKNTNKSIEMIFNAYQFSNKEVIKTNKILKVVK